MFGNGGPTFWELAEQAMSSTQRGYDLLAPKFEQTPFRTPDPILEAVAKHAGDVDAAIDLCCGTGAAFAHLRARRMVGVDFSPGMLEVAAERAGTLGREVELVERDVLTLDDEGVFDLATCFGAFGHILPRDEPRLVRTIHRILKPGGRFVFATVPMPRPTSPGYWVARAFNAAMHVRNALWRPQFIMYYLTFTLPDCVQLLERAGFSVRVDDPALDAPFAPIRVVTATK